MKISQMMMRKISIKSIFCNETIGFDLEFSKYQQGEFVDNNLKLNMRWYSSFLFTNLRC
jgi:hypothetical protein